MLTRRALLFSKVSMLPVGLGATLPVRAQDTTQRASAFIKDTGDKLIAVANGPESDREKRRRIIAIIDDSTDVDPVARYCLGRYWRNASPEQQQTYTKLFHLVMGNIITAKLGEYRSVRFTVGQAQQRDDDVVVPTVVERPNNPPNNVDWVIRDPAGAMKIIDVVAEGTSLRLTQRADYASFLNRNNNNIDALIDAIRNQVAEQQVK